MIKFKDEELNMALESFVTRIKKILGEKVGMICLYGSITYDDLSPYYGDLDFHCLLNEILTQHEINELFEYRDELKRSQNIFLQMLEGEFAPKSLCNEDKTANVAYWGTSRVKVFNKITVRTFSLLGLIKKGIVIYGPDWRNKYRYPTRQEMIDDVYNMIRTIRKHAVTTDEDIHSIDWLFLLSQSMFWIVNGDVTSKSNAAKWAYVQGFNEWVNCLPKALKLRKHPLLAQLTENKIWLANLGPDIQRACDDLEHLILSLKDKD